VNPKPLEFLLGAKALIDDPEKWFQKTPNSRSGCHCSITALITAGDNIRIRDGFEPFSRDPEFTVSYNEAYQALAEEMNGFIISFNDNHTHKQVMEAFDRAIEKISA
jgi:hypothetical protein